MQYINYFRMKKISSISSLYRQKDQNGREEGNKVKEEGMRNKGKEEAILE